jgi:hypothetical protein
MFSSVSFPTKLTEHNLPAAEGGNKPLTGATASKSSAEVFDRSAAKISLRRSRIVFSKFLQETGKSNKSRQSS